MLYDPKWETTNTDSTAKTMLADARKLIERPENWCQGSLSVRADGTRTIWIVADDAVASA